MIALFGLSCKEDEAPKKSFVDLAYTDIKALESHFSTQEMVVKSSNGVLSLPLGTVIIYKTNAGNYGKLKINEVKNTIPKDLVIDVANYNESGNQVFAVANVVVHAASNFDLDAGLNVDGNDLSTDLLWNVEATKSGIVPKSTAIFYVYSK